MKKTRKVLGLLAVFSAIIIGLTGCNTDKDKNGKDDREESKGVYVINAYGYEDVRKEAIEIVDVTSEKQGEIYASNVNKKFTFNKQSITISEFEGNIWYGTVKCTDGNQRKY